MIGDCPSCDAANTLEPFAVTTLHDEYGDTGIVQERYVYCTCCARTCRVDADGRLLVERDVSGTVIDGP